MNAEQLTYVEHLRITNKARTMKLYLEPWGDELEFPSGSTYEIIARGPQCDCLEVVFEQAAISVYAWSGATLSVLHKGKLLLGL